MRKWLRSKIGVMMIRGEGLAQDQMVVLPWEVSRYARSRWRRASPTRWETKRDRELAQMMLHAVDGGAEVKRTATGFSARSADGSIVDVTDFTMPTDRVAW